MTKEETIKTLTSLIGLSTVLTAINSDHNRNALHNGICALIRESKLRDACQRTIDENLHLADGNDCALVHLKRALAEDGVKNF